MRHRSPASCAAGRTATPSPLQPSRLVGLVAHQRQPHSPRWIRAPIHELGALGRKQGTCSRIQSIVCRERRNLLRQGTSSRYFSATLHVQFCSSTDARSVPPNTLFAEAISSLPRVPSSLAILLAMHTRTRCEDAIKFTQPGLDERGYEASIFSAMLHHSVGC
jgi:hypothetical protein